MRTIVRLVVSFLLAAFVTPALAQGGGKIFSLQMSYPSPANPGYYRAVFTNETPGPSTINSIYLYFPAGASIADKATDIKLQSVTNNSKVDVVGNRIAISYMPGIPSKGGTWWVDVKLTNAPACALWNAEAFAGNAFSQPFDLLADKSVLYAGTASGCAVKVDLSPTSVSQNSKGVAMTATITTPGPSFGAVTLQVPAGIKVTSATAPAVVNATGTQVSATNLTGKPGTPVVLSFTADFDPYCSAQSLVWTPTVYAGTGTTGSTRTIDASSATTTQVTATACGVTLSPTITNASADNDLPDLKVTVTGGSGSGDITMSTSGAGCSLGGTTTGTFTGGTGTISGLYFQDAGTCSLTATVSGPEYNTSYTIAGITVYPYGELDCSQQLATAATNPNSLPTTAGGWAAAFRSFNSNGGCTAKVNYEVRNTILDNDTFGLIWSGDSSAAFSLSANFRKRVVDISSTTGNTGWLAALPRPELGWKRDTSGNPIFIKGITCVAPGEAVTYAKVKTISGTTLVVDAVSNAAPTPTPKFVVEVEGQRLVVTAVSGSTWTLASAPSPTPAAGALITSKYPLLPELYGVVSGAISCASGTTGCTLTITDRTRDIAPRPTVIQVAKQKSDGTFETERMVVTDVSYTASGATLTVNRQDGGTGPIAVTGGENVVSMPLPLIPADAIPASGPAAAAYVAGTPAQMCVFGYGWYSGGIFRNPDNASDPRNGAQQIIPFMEWLDLGDGWGRVQ